MGLAVAVRIASEFTGRVPLLVAPQLLQKLTHCRYELAADLPELTRLIKMDPTLCFMAMRLDRCMEPADQTNVPFSIDAVVDRIGMTGADAIISQILSDQVLDNAQHQRGRALQWLWQQSLTTAMLAKHLATAIDDCTAEEAYIAGLLHGIGKLALFARTPAACAPMLMDPAQAISLLEAEEQVAGFSQERIGAYLIRRFTRAWFAADAAAFHTASETQIRQAFPLVQIVWAASRLAAEPLSASPIHESALALLGIDISELERISRTSEEEVRTAVDELGPGTDTEAPTSSQQAADHPEPLIQAIQNRTALAHVYRELLHASDQIAVRRVLRQSLSLFLGIEAVVIFDHDPQQDCLAVRWAAGMAAHQPVERLRIPLRASNCLPAVCHTGEAVVDSFSRTRHNPLTIIDRQLLTAMGTDGFICLPIRSGRGCMLAGIEAHDWPWSPRRKTLLTAVAAAAEEALLRIRSGDQRLTGPPIDQEKRVASETRKIVHEINNPLSIIKNYLKVLARRADQKQPVEDHIRIINEEIDRVGTLVRSLTQPAAKKRGQMKIVDVNATIKDILVLFNDDLSSETAIRIDEDLDPRIPAIRTDRDRLKQALMNLLKNAAEAMPDGGVISVRTRIQHRLPRHTDGPAETGYIKVSVCDDGPGIDEELQNDLFKPHVTSKAGHAGLGLSIVHEAITCLNGTLLCESAPGRGTCFHIELPAIDNEF